MREQSLEPKMGQKRRRVIMAISACCILLAIGLGVAAYNMEYKHPKFEENAKKGLPEVEDSFLYQTVNSRFEYDFDMALNVYQQADGSCKVYFSNREDCPYYLLYEMRDQKSNELYYKSGVLKPGEYVESLELQGKTIREERKVDVIVRAYEKDTWYSAGNTNMELVLQPW